MIMKLEKKPEISKRIKGSMLLLLVILMMTGCSVANPREDNELAYRKAGIQFLNKGAYESAVSAFQKALDNSNGRITEVELDICYYKAFALIQLGNYEEAMKVYDAIITYDKKATNAYFQKGNLYAVKGDVKNAVSYYNKAIKMDSSDYELYISAYNNLISIEEAKEAAQGYLKQGLGVTAKTGVEHRNKGRIYLLLEDYEDAKHELSLAENENDEEAKLYMGKAMEMLGDKEGAFAIYESYAKAHENDGNATCNLIKILMLDEKYDVALTYMEEGLKHVPDERRHELEEYQIIIYEKLGQYEKAESLLSKFVKEYPEDEKAAKELIFLQSRNQKEDEGN